MNPTGSSFLKMVGGAVLSWSAVCEAAEAPKVLLVYPAEAQPSVSSALVRVRGELVADGFDVVLVRADPGTTSTDAMGEAENNIDSATVGLFLSADGASAELWVVDKLTNKTVVRRVNTAGESSNQLSEVLAMRAVELLRASLLEFLVAQRQSEERSNVARPPVKAALPREIEQKAVRWAARPLDDKLWWNIELGPTMLVNPGQVGPQLGFFAGIRVRLLPALQVGMSSIGLGSSPVVESTGGSARIQQWYGLAEVTAAPWPALRLRPVFILGLGAHHLSVDGRASWPYQSLNSAVWALAADGGLGLEWKLSVRLAVTSEGHVLFSSPHPGLYFVGHRAANVGEPTLAVSGALKVSL